MQSKCVILIPIFSIVLHWYLFDENQQWDFYFYLYASRETFISTISSMFLYKYKSQITESSNNNTKKKLYYL